MRVEKVGIVDEDGDSDNGACDATTEDDADATGSAGAAGVAVGDSCTFDGAWDSDSLALAACFPGLGVGAGYFLHSSSISAKISSDVGDVDEDGDEDAAVDCGDDAGEVL